MARKRGNKGVGGMVGVITLAYLGYKFFFGKKPAAPPPPPPPPANQVAKSGFEAIESWEV